MSHVVKVLLLLQRSAKHAHRVINLANEDVNLVGTIDQTWSHFHGRAMLITFEFACKRICSFGETSEQESFFIEVLFAVFRPLFGRVSSEELSFVNLSLAGSTMSSSIGQHHDGCRHISRVHILAEDTVVIQLINCCLVAGLVRSSKEQTC